MRRTFVLLTAAVVALLAVLWSLSGPGQDSEDIELVSTRDEGMSAPEGARLRGAQEAESEERVAPRPTSPTWGVTGRVVRSGRVPAAGTVLKLLAGTEARTPDDVCRSDEAGWFRLRPKGPVEDGLAMFRIVADDGVGQVASKEIWNVKVPRDADVDAGILLLEEGNTLQVRVESEGRPVAGAHVQVRFGGWQHQGWVGQATSDADGIARVDGLLPLVYEISARAEGLVETTMLIALPLPAGEPARMVLDPPRTLQVEVVAAPDLAPVAGVEVRVVTRLALHKGYREAAFEPEEPPLPTDATGRTWIRGLGRSPDLRLGVLARGYARARYHSPTEAWIADCNRTIPIPPHEDSIRVVLPAARRVTWPLAKGDAPLPSEGTRVRLDAGTSGMRPWGVDEGVVEDGQLVVEGLEDAWFSARARTPDGLVARVYVGPGVVEGETVTFWRPRALEVFVHEPSGAPLGKASVRIDAGRPQITTPFAHTDAEGVARWNDLPAVRGRLVVDGAVDGPAPFDLFEGDQRIEIVAKPEAASSATAAAEVVEIHVRLGGEAHLPDSYELRATDFLSSIRQTGEEVDTATIHARWTPPPAGGPGRFVLLSRGFQPAAFVVGIGTTAVDLDLSPGCVLHVHLLHEQGQSLRYRLERYEAGERAWREAPLVGVLRPGVNLRPLPRPTQGTERRYDGLAPGRYRVVDSRSGRHSDEAWLSVGDPPAVVTLDLSPAAEIRGTVVVPPGYDAEESIVVATVGETRSETRVDALGRFALPWPDDAESVELLVRHPLLSQDPTTGRIRLREPREGVRLELMRGALAEVEIQVTSPVQGSVVPHRDPRVVLLPVGQDGPSLVLPARLEAGEGGAWILTFAGYPPGRWTIWGNVFTGLAPLRLEGAELHEIGAFLGPVAVGPGSTIHVRVEPREGRPAALLLATATYEGTPPHERQAAEVDGWEIRLVGLEAGRYHLRAGPAALDREDPPTAVDEVIEVDGRSEYKRTVAPR